ncbi:hypothetical protein V8E36_000143 [Tilletia maclaganii]
MSSSNISTSSADAQPAAAADVATPSPEITTEPVQELTSILLDEDEDEPKPNTLTADQQPPAPLAASTPTAPVPVIVSSESTSTIDQSRASIQTTGSANTAGTHSPYEVFGDRSLNVQDSLLPVILGIAVVDFNHLVGPQIEFAHPNSLLDDPDLSTNLPFLALPDGSHLSDEDFCYFHLHAPNLSPSTIFGISCNRQIASDALLKKGAEVTRSTVQKAVVVLAREPVFGPIREKLGIVTRAFFAQGDLADINILIDFHATLEAGLQSGGFSTDREAALYMGTSLREFIYKWRSKTLVFVKLLLLQRNIMFYGYPIEQLCTQQYSLVSLIPGLLASLQDAGLPVLDTRTATRAQAESLRTSDRKSLLRYLGMPLNLFGASAFFQPYLPLQQIDLLKGSTYLVGTSNSIYRQQRDCAIDVIADLESSSLDFVNPLAQKLSALTAADRKWIAELEQLVLSTWNPADPTRPVGMQYEGSDDHLRAKFEEYICALLASIKHFQFDKAAGRGDAALAGASASSTQAFGPDFIEAFMQTKAFPSWNLSTDPMIFDIVDHRHPCDGKTSAIEDVGLRLAAGLQDMHLEENLAPARQAIGSAIQQGGAGLYRFANGLKSEVAKLREARQAAAAAASSAPGGSGQASDPRGSVALSPKDVSLGSSPNTSQRNSGTASSPLSPSSFMAGFRIPSTNASSTTAGGSSSRSSTTSAAAAADNNAAGSSSQFADVAAQTADRAAQAAAQAGTQVRAALGTFGSFLAKQQRQWSAGSAPGAAGASGSGGGAAPVNSVAGAASSAGPASLVSGAGAGTGKDGSAAASASAPPLPSKDATAQNNVGTPAIPPSSSSATGQAEAGVDAAPPAASTGAPVQHSSAATSYPPPAPSSSGS